jgi:hypothetical protein
MASTTCGTDPVARAAAALDGVAGVTVREMRDRRQARVSYPPDLDGQVKRRLRAAGLLIVVDWVGAGCLYVV